MPWLDYLLVQEEDLVHALAFILRGIDIDFAYPGGYGVLADVGADGGTLAAVDGGICRAYNLNLLGVGGQGYLRVERALAAVVEAGQIRIHQGARILVRLNGRNSHAEECELNLLRLLPVVGEGEGVYFLLG